MKFDQPEDDNFASWYQPLWTNVQSSCSATPSFQGPHALQLGGAVFDKMSESRSSALNKLTAALDGESTLGSYIGGALVGGIIYLIVAFIAFIVAIIAVVALATPVRQCISRWCCGSCRTRSRIRLKAVKPHNRSFLFIANFLGLLAVIAGFVFIVLTSVQGIAGTNRSVCGVWLGLYGHYFGVGNITPVKETSEIAWSWNGSHNIMNQLRDLDQRLEPGVSNPVYQEMLALYHELQKSANDSADRARSNVEALIYETKSWNETWQEWTGLSTVAGSKAKLTRWKMLATEAAVGKGEVYLKELDDTLEEGWEEMERLIELYSGPNARLMKKASDAVKDTFLTIADIDAVVAGLTRMWSDLSGSLRGLMLTLFSLHIVVMSFALLTALGLMYLTVDLVKRLQNDQFPNKAHRRAWAIAYGVFAILAGLSIMLSALAFLVTAVGSDACPLLKTVVFEEGRWDLLGDSYLHPRDPMNVDIDVVFNTCLRRDGTGDVASALGLDGRIAELAEDTDAAIADIVATRDRLLNRREKTTRAQVLVVAYKDLLELQAKAKPFTDVSATQAITGYESVAFNETEFVRFDADDYETIGRRSVLCVVPQITGGVMDAAMDCVGQGVQFDIAPHNRAVDVLVDSVNFVYTHGEPDGVPRQFCSEHAARQNHPCAEIPDAYMLTAQVYSDASKWEAAINKVVPDSGTYGHPNYKIGGKIMDLIYQLADINDLTQRQIAELPAHDNADTSLVNAKRTHLVCPDGSQTCRIDEARQVGLKSVYSKAEQVVPDTLELFSLFDEYVEADVTPIMESLVADANAVTEGSNCQFEGTAFDLGGVDPLCLNTFPAMLLATVLLSVASVVFLLFAIHTWKWYHYMEDLALECKDDGEKYDAQKAPAELNSMMSDLVAIYNQSPRYLAPVISGLGQQTPPTAAPEPVNFQEAPRTGRSVPATPTSVASQTPMAPLTPYALPTPRTDVIYEPQLVSGELFVPDQGGTSFDSDLIPISAATRYR